MIKYDKIYYRGGIGIFLYDKKEKSFDVYNFAASRDDLVCYRRAQMEQIPEQERVFMAEAHIDPYEDSLLFEKYTGKTFNERVLSAGYADNDSEERKQSNAYRRYHVLKRNNSSKENNKRLLEGYVLGYLADRSVVQIQFREL